MQDVDFVIVGAGTAGCTLAARLSEDPQARVLLLEAGGAHDRHPLVQVPLGVGKLHEHAMFDWGLESEPEPALDGRRLEAMRGKLLGGSSSINMMTITRGDAGDFDRWARNGARGWSYADVLPYFRRMEGWTGTPSPLRGRDGPVRVERGRFRDPLNEGWKAAGRLHGFATNEDYNGQTAEGFGLGQYFIHRGRRMSAARAYLRPAMGRGNLRVVTGAHATRIVFEGSRAVGVEYHVRGRPAIARAAREVVLAAGSFNTPQLLMLSGIGPADELRDHGIPVRADLPVGHNLQDHLAVMLRFERRDHGPFRAQMRVDRMAVNMLRAWLLGSGPATTLPSDLFAFVKTRQELAVPNIEFMFRCAVLHPYLWFPLLRPGYVDGYGIRPTLLHPRSRGRVRLRSADPFDRVRIAFNAFAEPADLDELHEGYECARDVAYSAPMDAFRGRQIAPDPAAVSPEAVKAWIRRTAITAHHPAGTCAMGDHAQAVVDPELRVRGIEALRVADASVIPDMPSAHINACVFMIAERASDLLRAPRVARAA
jgi:choline dehydrogenase-like flavoprotein